jgi:Flp pilus assembly protein TadD
MRLISSIAGFVAAVLIPVSLFAQTDSGSIQGKVLDREGKPLPGAIARVQNTSTNQIDEAKTNKNGGYSIAGLYQGKYKVTLIVDGHAAMVRGEAVGDDIFVNSGQEQTINFDLRKAPATPPPDVAPAPANAANKGKSDADKKASAEMRAAFNAGMAALKAQNLEEAIKQFQLAGEKDPSQPAIFGNLGLALLRSKKYDDAAAAFRKSIALNPGDAGVHASLSLALGESGKIEEAQQEVQEVAKLDPSLAGQGYYNLGAILSERGKSKEGVELFKKAIEIDPKNTKSYYQLGLAYFGSPDTMPAAITALEKYLQLEPNGENAPTAKQLIEAAKASAPRKD